LLFTDKDVLPHELGAGSASFNHHPVSSQQTITVQETDISLSDTKPKGVSHCHGDVDSVVTTEIEQLKIDETSTLSSASKFSHGVCQLHDAPNKCTGATCDDPNTTHHSPLKAKLIHCTSLFIDTVEWLSSVVVGTLDGKVSVHLFACIRQTCIKELWATSAQDQTYIQSTYSRYTI